MPGVVRYFSSFSAALEEVKNARVFGGIHFRSACNDGQTLGSAVGDYILGHALLPVHGKREGQIEAAVRNVRQRYRKTASSGASRITH